MTDVSSYNIQICNVQIVQLKCNGCKDTRLILITALLVREYG
jgi:hypothetical protein